MKNTTRRGLIVGGAASLLASAAGSEAAGGAYRGYETPKWRVLKADKPFELRDYAPYLAAEVTIKAGPDAALRQGFRTLAGFIFGGNTGSAKVAMTAPVTRTPAEIAMTAPVTREATGDAWTVRFMMPSGYTADTLPRPENAAIRIVTVEPGLRAVHRFAGLAGPARISKAQSALEAWIRGEGMVVTGPADAAWFDDPFTLPWRRRNEVSLPVAMA